LCSVMMSDSRIWIDNSANGPVGRQRRRRAWMLHSIFEASNNSIRSKCNLHFCIAQLPMVLAIAPARPVFFDGDFGVADRDHAEQQRAAESADHGAERH